VLCSPRLFAAQVAALEGEAEIVVPDWRRAPLSIWDSWETAHAGWSIRCRRRSSRWPACRSAACWRSRSCSSLQIV
jgi:hypothetical protein